jgi:hypothetical protein
MTGVERLGLKRITTADEATALIGEKVPPMTPTIRGPVLLHDEETGEPLLGHLPLPDLARFRAVILAIDWGSSNNTYRQTSGNRNRSQTFGYRPRKPMMRNEGCVLTAFGRDHPDLHAYLAHYAEVLAGQLAESFPEIEVMGREVVEQVLPDWRLTDHALWTSGVINKESPLPYHRDGNNFDAWSVMPVVRRGVRGGHLHLPEYNLVVPCRDGYSVAFFGKRIVHGVTPMDKIAKDAYRVSVVYYALRGLKDCHTFAEETARAQVKRTERETRLGSKADALDGMNIALSHAPSGLARMRWENHGKFDAQ